MKSLLCLIIAASLFLISSNAKAQVIVNVDENGGGTMTLSSGLVIPTPVTIASPPVYHLAAPLGFVPMPGDVVLTDGSAANPQISDLLRFDANGNVTIFSDRDATENDPLALADVGIPPVGTVATFLPETDTSGNPVGSPDENVLNGLFGYTPALGPDFPARPRQARSLP